MIVNIEFLVAEPIENVITSLHFKIDKTVFLGYEDVIRTQKRAVERFLLKYCGVKEVVFCPVSKNDFTQVTETIKNRVQKEKEQGNKLFFDITGGEAMVMAAFGMLSREMGAPMHMFDVPSAKLTELDTGLGISISKAAESRKLALNLNMYIEMHGGRINYRLNKALASAADEDFELLMPKLWKVSKENAAVWNAFSDLLKRHSQTEYGLTVELSAREVASYLQESRTLNSLKRLKELLEDCRQEGLLEQVSCEDGLYFRYKNAFVKECILNTGSILELHTYMEEKAKSSDCLVGIHLDWDGIFHEKGGEDVLNEVDVLALQGYVPVFISCKNGHVDKEALYELEAVTDKFGGKYAKKVLVATKGLSRTDLNRAREMNIEVR